VESTELVTMTTTSPPAGFTADPIIPARDVLLDATSVAEIVGRLYDRQGAIESCTLRRAKYRIGESLRVVYDVVADGRNFVISARTFQNSADALRRAQPSAEAVGGMPGVARDPGTHTVWWTLPNDRRLRNIVTLLDPPRRVRESSGVAWDQSVLVEYAPERSATARILDAHGQISGFAKAYRDRDAFEVATQYNRVAASIALLDGIRTPRALGWARPDRIVVLEPMRGRTWTHLPADIQPVAMRHLGQALANVHGLPTDFGRGPFQRYRMERVLNSADLVAIARTDVEAAAKRLRDKLAEGPPPKATVVCLHGDVHANNVLFHGDEVHIIDFDQGGSGAASADIGSMLASLMTARLIDPLESTEGLATAFLEGYTKVRALPSAPELRWYTGAALVAERAIRAVNRVNLPVLAILPELLKMAEAVLAGKVRIDE
jgi:aminoglycoside phosphotransferase (APT) family kinase protein